MKNKIDPRDTMDYTFLITKGIDPQKVNPEDSFCTIGFCEKNQKWYGWTWNKVCGFGIGAVVDQGCSIARKFDEPNFEEESLFPIGFKANTLEDCRLMAIAFAN